jgi:hypothetical protein
LVYKKEAVMALEFILPILGIEEITELSDTGKKEEILEKLG